MWHGLFTAFMVFYGKILIFFTWIVFTRGHRYKFIWSYFPFILKMRFSFYSSENYVGWWVFWWTLRIFSPLKGLQVEKVFCKKTRKMHLRLGYDLVSPSNSSRLHVCAACLLALNLMSNLTRGCTSSFLYSPMMRTDANLSSNWLQLLHISKPFNGPSFKITWHFMAQMQV